MHRKNEMFCRAVQFEIEYDRLLVNVEIEIEVIEPDMFDLMVRGMP